MKILLTIAVALSAYLVCFGAAILFGIGSAFARAGGEVDPYGYMAFAIPAMIIHATLMNWRGTIPLLISTLILSALYYFQAQSAAETIIANLHPDYIRIKGNLPPFDAKRWLELRWTLPTTNLCIASAMALVVFIAKKGLRWQRSLESPEKELTMPSSESSETLDR